MISEQHAKQFEGKRILVEYFTSDNKKDLLIQRGKVNLVTPENLFLVVSEGKAKKIEVYNLDFIERIILADKIKLKQEINKLIKLKRFK